MHVSENLFYLPTYRHVCIYERAYSPFTHGQTDLPVAFSTGSGAEISLKAAGISKQGFLLFLNLPLDSGVRGSAARGIPTFWLNDFPNEIFLKKTNVQRGEKGKRYSGLNVSKVINVSEGGYHKWEGKHR